MTSVRPRPQIFSRETVLGVEGKGAMESGLLFVNNNKGSKVAVDDEIVPRRNMTIAEGVRPLLASMKLFGLYFSPPSKDAGDDPKEQKSRKWNAYIIYPVAVVVLLWINAIRAFSVFTRTDKFGVVLFNKLILINWCMQCAVSQTAFYAASYSGRLASVFNQDLDDHCARHARKSAIVFTAIAWLVITAGSSFIIYGLLITDGEKDYFITPLQNHIVVSNPLIPRIIACVVIVYVLSAHIFSQTTTFVLAKIFSHQFMKVNETLRSFLQDNDRRQVSETDIELLRQKHQQIAMNVNHVDDCLMFSNASAFCCQVFSAIILLYTITFCHSTVGDPVFISCYIFWMFLVSVGLALTAAGGIMVHHYVR